VLCHHRNVCTPLADPSGPGAYPLLLTILIGVAAGAACGTINGLAIAFGNVPPFIATLGMMSAARAIALIVSDGKPIYGFTDAFNFIGGGILLGLPMPIWILALMFLIGFVILHKTKFGVYIYAIGSNENAAKVSGVKVRSKKMLVYTLAGAFAGVAAVVLTSRILAGQPAVGSGYEMDAITGAIIGGASFSGGIGTMAGTIVGALIMGVLTNGMTMLQIDPSLQMLVKGIVIVGAVLLDERKHRHRK
jgi:ribose/xylose/arabinose/galactoside ABC-type transport system permease subunit